MSMIIPSGYKKLEWAPKDDTVVKTAGAGEKEQEDVNPLYEAAKKVLKAQMDLLKDEAPCADKGLPGAAPCLDKGLPGASPCDAAGVPPSAAPIAEEAPIAKTETDVQQAVKELVEKSNKAEEIAVKVQDAVAKVEEAVEGVKEAVGGGEVTEVEIEFEDGEVEVENEGDEKGEKEEKDEGDEKGGPDFLKESKEPKDDKDDKKPEEKKEKEACATNKKLQVKEASADEFCKFASLSPKNRKKLVEFWVGMLNYPKDYIDMWMAAGEKK